MDRIDGLPLLQESAERQAIRFIRQGLSIPGRQFHNPRPALGRTHHAPNRRRAVRGERPRHHFVGSYHEVFNQSVGARFFRGHHAAHLTFGHNRLRLRPIELQSTHLVPLSAQQTRRLVLQLELCLQIRRRRHFGVWTSRAFQPRTNPAIRQLRLVAHQREIDLGIRNRTIARHDQFDDDGYPVLVFIQRCQVR